MSEVGNVAVFGLGSMGSGVAGSLLSSGFRVFVFDPDEGRVADLVEQGGRREDLKVCGGNLEIVLLVVLNAEQAESVICGNDGLLEHLSPGACVVNCATVAPGFARDMEKNCNNKGIHYLDAPISGGSVKAADGRLSVMAAGTDAAFAAARPALDAAAETVFELGNRAGPGSAMKAVNQLLAGIHIASMGEAITFGISQGIDPANLVDVISRCAGSSWMFENRGPHVVQGDYTPHSAVNIWLKDLGIVLDVAAEADFPAVLTEKALSIFRAAAENGLGLEDDAAVAKVYAEIAGLELPVSPVDGEA